MSENTIKAINRWSKLDRDPAKTLDGIKKVMDYRKKMVRKDPMKLFKEMDYQAYLDYIAYMKEVKSHYAITKGYSPDRSLKDNLMVPLVLWNLDPEYWTEVTRRKHNLIHTEFLVSNPKPSGTKRVN